MKYIKITRIVIDLERSPVYNARHCYFSGPSLPYVSEHFHSFESLIPVVLVRIPNIRRNKMHNNTLTGLLWFNPAMQISDTLIGSFVIHLS